LAAVFSAAFANRVNAADKELPPAATGEIDFVKQVQPMLRKHCYSCHGAEMQEGGLRLDNGRRAREGGDNGVVIVAKKPRESKLLTLVAGLDEELGLMPPEGEGAPLTAEQVGVLRAWIEQGAAWPAAADGKLASSHWSFQPIVRPPVPAVKNKTWALNPIDAFILRKLEAEGVAPSPAASREMLIRRLFLDVLGVAPSVKQLREFLNDKSPHAYERLVDRVLESPHYGERWGRHWLDLARYADSDGYEKDRPRPHAWRYRQWVIDALNADMPFDQFSIEQIAGDIGPDAALEMRVATGFHRNTLHNTEGGTDKEEDRVKKTVDRTNTIGSIWLGLTIGCAQCHSHKYDPISQREYYQFYSFFNNIDEVDISAPLPAEAAKYQKAKQAFDKAQAALDEQVEKYRRDLLPAAAAKWAATGGYQPTVWIALTASEVKSRHGATLTVQDDKSILATGENKLSDAYTIVADLPTSAVSAIRLEVLTDKSLVKNGPGRANNGNFVLTTFTARILPAEGEPIDLKFTTAAADFSQKEWEVGKAISGDGKDGWAVSPQIGKPHTAMFVVEKPVAASNARLEIVLDQNYFQAEPHNIGRFRLSVTPSGKPDLQGVDQALAAALEVEETKRNEAQKKLINDFYAGRDPELLKLQKVAADHAKQAPKESGVKAQSVSERAARETRIHLRGDFLNKGDLVNINTPVVLPRIQPRDKRLDRLDFAQWLFSKEHPLTARVTVNRIWQRYFGVGLTARGDDFGSQGESPSHPELLDFVASEFRDGGWKLKSLHKLILTSATYRQSSAYRSELVDRDPNNRWLARQIRRRVEAEIVRDLALSVSGLLDPKVGGPSVRPPQPAEYSNLTYANSAKWAVSKGGDRYRRGLYTFFQRTSPYPMLMTFDSPDSNECTAQRSTSNTPLQALTLWNDPVFFECAQVLGRRILIEGPREGVSERVDFAFQLALARSPSADESGFLAAVYDGQKKLAGADPEGAKRMIGERPLPTGADVVETAAWVMVGRVLINLDEFVTKE
jgi:hypothetical protein